MSVQVESSTQPPTKQPATEEAGFSWSSWTRRLRQGDFGLLPVIGALALIWVFFYSQFPVFLDPRNLSFLLLQITVLGVLAVGVVLVLLLGEIDLSAAAAAGTCAAIVAVLLSRYEWPVVAAVAVGLVAALVIGLVQSFFVAVAGVPSFVVTLAGLLALQGFMLLILGQQGTVNVNDRWLLKLASVYVPPPVGWGLLLAAAAAHLFVVLRRRQRRAAADLAVRPLWTQVAQSVVVLVVAALAVWRLNQYLGVPLAGLVLLAIIGIWSIVLRHTAFGRAVYSVGGNAEAARRAGINVVRVRMSVMALATLMFAIAGVIGASRYASVSYNAFAGGSLLLEAIGAAVIGGTSLFGGRGRIVSALVGALVIGSLSNGLNLYSASSAIKYIVTGAILLAAVTIDALSRKRRAASGTA
jgi:D-xylose transport system permease protein